jgi:hypothetical protein
MDTQHHGLSDAEVRDLRALAAQIIPASTAYGVPGADDDKIFEEVLKSLERDREDVCKTLADLTKLSGGAFSDLSPERRTMVAATLREQGGLALAALVRVVLLCYYRDDRVMHSLGQEPRAPFPKGHVLEQGDHALLDPVRKRQPLWRRVK